MEGPAAEEWSFGKIREIDRDRADYLESLGPACELLAAIRASLKRAIDESDIRIGIDSRDNRFEEIRTIIQFKISTELYDWFFNARTGYRAQFWVGTKHGADFNMKIANLICDVLREQLNSSVSVSKIRTDICGYSREDKIVAKADVAREVIVNSLEPHVSKIWICERLIRDNKIDDIGFAVVSDAARHLPKLCIPRWATARNPKTGEVGEGLRAPYPCPDYAWFDLKGGFIGRSGKIEQIKSQEDRAQALHERGWT